jgi:hypothetical protein
LTRAGAENFQGIGNLLTDDGETGIFPDMNKQQIHRAVGSRNRTFAERSLALGIPRLSDGCQACIHSLPPFHRQRTLSMTGIDAVCRWAEAEAYDLRSLKERCASGESSLGAMLQNPLYRRCRDYLEGMRGFQLDKSQALRSLPSSMNAGAPKKTEFADFGKMRRDKLSTFYER